MGCDNSTDNSSASMEDIAIQYGLIELISKHKWENELERQIFIAINVCRREPKAFVNIVKQVRLVTTGLLAIGGVKELLKQLSEMPKLPPIEYSQQIASACQINNKRVCDRAMVDEGGNKEALVGILEREIKCEEITYKDW